MHEYEYGLIKLRTTMGLTAWTYKAISFLMKIFIMLHSGGFVLRYYVDLDRHVAEIQACVAITKTVC